MIKKINYLILSLLILACAPSKKRVSCVGCDPVSGIEIESSSNKESIQFIVRNKSNTQMFIHNYMQLNIERLVDGKWEKVRILNCPCGAPCARPAEFIAVAKDGNFTFTWDRVESWCGEKNSYGIPESMKLSVTAGRYRIMVIYSLDGRDTKVFYKEFNV